MLRSQLSPDKTYIGFSQDLKRRIVAHNNGQSPHTIPHSKLLSVVAKRVSDGVVLALIKQWLKAPVIEEDDDGKRRIGGGGKANRQGTPHRTSVPMVQVIAELNRTLRGWSNYFYYRNSTAVMSKVKMHVEQRVRTHLRRRHKLISRAQAYQRFPGHLIYGRYGLYKLPTTAPWRSARLGVKNIGKPCTGKPYARFDEGGLVRLAMPRLLRHRHTKGAETDRPRLR